MIDRLTAMSWLEGLAQDDWRECHSDSDVQEIARQTLAILKEQDAEWIEYPECLAYDGAYSDSHIVCSACKHVFSTMDNCTEEFDYCPHCGAKMKQEGR